MEAKTKKVKPLKCYLKIRTYTDGKPIADVWLMRKEGAAHSCLLHGEMTQAEMMKLRTWFRELGVEVEKEISPLEGYRLGSSNKKQLFDVK